MKMPPRRQGLTLIELAVVIGIVGIFAGMLIPAVQSIRETARASQCKNNLRQLGLAAMGFENSHGYLPGPWFNAPPDSPEYHADRGLFVQLLDFTEESSRSAVFRLVHTTHDLKNVPMLVDPAQELHCPSASGPPAVLTEIASVFSGPAVPGLRTATCDYIGNGGYAPIHDIRKNPSLYDGPIGVQISRSSLPKETPARIHDGLSNTLLFWESIGNTRILDGGHSEVEINSFAKERFGVLAVGPPIVLLRSFGAPSTKSYHHSWGGLRIGNMREVEGRVINIGNTNGEPCSRHPSGASAVLADCSTRMLSRDIAPEIANALASSRGVDLANE